MNHHKLLGPDECHTFDEFINYVKYVLRFEKNTTNYFESKCRYYFNIKMIKFEFAYGEHVEEMKFDDLLKHDLVEFQILYNKLDKRIVSVSLFVKNKGSKGKKFYQLEIVDLMSL